MPISVKRFPNEPIIMMSVTDPVDFMEELPPAYDQIADLAEGIEGRIYRITDFSQVDNTVGRLINILVRSSKSQKGSITDPEMRARTQSILVGTSQFVRMGANILNRQFGIELSIFDTVDEALEYVRRRSGDTAESTAA